MIQDEKLALIEQILHVQDDEIIRQVAHWLQELQRAPVEPGAIPPMPPISEAEYRASLKQAMRNVTEGDVLEHDEVLRLIQQWRNR